MSDKARLESLLKPGSRVRIYTKSGLSLEGLVLPRYELYKGKHITLKLDNGYNIGISLDNIERVESLEPRALKAEEHTGEIVPEAPKPRKGLPKTLIVGTGGTIASRVDYQTGGVKPELTSKELLEAIPELAELAEIEASVLFNILSENMEPEHWTVIAEKIARYISEDPKRGIVITHGTDTMAYTAAALSFALQNLPVPIALVGAQRSSDRPSSDAALNLIAAVLYSQSNIGEVAVVMHGETGDTYMLAHRGVRVRKMHSTRRDAFQSIESLPLAKIYPVHQKLVKLRDDARARSRLDEFEPKVRFERRVALLKYHPGFHADIIDYLVDRGIRGIVLEGTGMGHVAERVIPSISRAIESGVIVVMTTQCIFGTVNLNVYSTGRMLLQAGVVPAGDMLPETALVKLSWLLANYDDTKEVVELFKRNLVGEYEERRRVDLFPRWPHG